MNDAPKTDNDKINGVVVGEASALLRDKIEGLEGFCVIVIAASPGWTPFRRQFSDFHGTSHNLRGMLNKVLEEVEESELTQIGDGEVIYDATTSPDE